MSKDESKRLKSPEFNPCTIPDTAICRGVGNYSLKSEASTTRPNLELDVRSDNNFYSYHQRRTPRPIHNYY